VIEEEEKSGNGIGNAMTVGVGHGCRLSFAI